MEKPRSFRSSESPFEFLRRRGGILPKLALAAAALILPVRKAVADAVSFGQDVNGLNGIQSSQLMPGVTADRARMTVSAEDAGQLGIYVKEMQVDDSPNGGIIVRGLGPATSIPNYNGWTDGAESLLEINRLDGRVVRIALGRSSDGPFHEVDVDGVERWDVLTNCGGYDLQSISPGVRIPNTIKFASRFVGFRGENKDILHAPVNPVSGDFCQDIRSAIDAAAAAGQDPFQAGILIPRESTAATEISAPETDELLALTRDTANGTTVRLLAWNPDGTLTHLQRNPNGTWTPEPNQTLAGTVDQSFNIIANAMLKRQTPSGREITLYVFYDGNVDGGLNVLALEKTADQEWTEVDITMEESQILADDDEDGTPNAGDSAAGIAPDNCPWRANPGQVDNNANGVGDACEANCEANGWPGTDSAPQGDPGHWECESELGYAHAVTRRDGTTIHSDQPLIIEADINGAPVINAQPGQTVEVIHSNDPRVPQEPSPRLRFPDTANSVTLDVYETSRLDGSPGTVSLSYHPVDDPFGEPVVWTANGPVVGQNLGVIFGDELGDEGTHYKVTFGNEQIPLPCVDEICDGMDNDCDGQIDEDIIQGCANECDNFGQQVCEGGVFGECDAEPCCVQTNNGIESCDGVDNDCNGTVDLMQNGQPLFNVRINECNNFCTEPCEDGAFTPCAPEACPPPEDAGNPQEDAGSPDAGMPEDAGQQQGDAGTSEQDAEPDAQPDAATQAEDAQPQADTGTSGEDAKTPDTGAPVQDAESDSGQPGPDVASQPDTTQPDVVAQTPDSGTPRPDAIPKPDAPGEETEGGNGGGCKCEIASAPVSPDTNIPYSLAGFALIAAAFSRRIRKAIQKVS